MLVRYYERNRTVTGYEHKPIIEKVFALKHDGAQKERPLKSIFVTDEELETLTKEFTKVMEFLIKLKGKDKSQQLSSFLGVDIEVVNEIGHESVDKVA